MLPLQSAWTYEAGLPPEAWISGPWDASVQVISGTCTDVICSFSPQCRLEEPVSVPMCCTSIFCYTNGLERPDYGSRWRTGLTDRDFGDPGACLRHRTIDLASRSADLIGYVYTISHSFIVVSCVTELGLEVETLEVPLHVSSPLGTRVSVDLICRGCELEISGILLILDLKVMDMTEFNVILGMDWLMTHRVVIDCESRKVTTYTRDGTRVTFQGDKHDALP